jgi:uncharacterized membrane protein
MTRFLSALAICLLLASAPAHAQLEICNRTAAPYSLAIAYETDADVVSQGWWTVAPDKCETVITGELKRRYFYHYAISRPLNVEWNGSFTFCVDDDPQFRITGASDCEQRSFRTLGFRQIDVGTSKSYALDISMGPAPAPKVEPMAAPAAEPAPPAAAATVPATAPAPAPPATTP